MISGSTIATILVRMLMFFRYSLLSIFIGKARRSGGPFWAKRRLSEQNTRA
jgi:hypothetical protein